MDNGRARRAARNNAYIVISLRARLARVTLASCGSIINGISGRASGSVAAIFARHQAIIIQTTSDNMAYVIDAPRRVAMTYNAACDKQARVRAPASRARAYKRSM